MLAFWALSRFLALAVGCLQMTLHILLYGVYMQRAGPRGLLPRVPRVAGCTALACLALICVVWLLSRLSRPDARVHASEILDCPLRP